MGGRAFRFPEPKTTKKLMFLGNRLLDETHFLDDERREQ